LFEPEDLLRVPNHNTIVRTLVNGVPTQPFSMSTVPPLGTPNPKLAIALKQLSAAKYGHPKAKVEAKIFERLATKEPPKPAYAGAGASPYAQPRAGMPPAQAGTLPPRPAPSRGGSFLDDW